MKSIFLLINILATIYSQEENSTLADTVTDTANELSDQAKNFKLQTTDYDFYADISKNPGYDGLFDVSGTYTITMDDEDDTLFQWSLTGLPLNSKGNWRILNVSSCDDDNASPISADGSTYDWESVSWESNGEGEAMGNLSIPEFTEEHIADTTLVVNNLGDQVACGAIQKVDWKKKAINLYKDNVEANPLLFIAIGVGIFFLCCCIGGCIFWRCRGKNKVHYENQD